MGLPIIGDVINAVKDIVSEVVVDRDKRDELNVRLQELADKANQREHEQMLAQTEVNKAEAASDHWFVAGWRPAVGWVGATGLAYSFILAPLLSWVARVWGGYSGDFPALETEQLMVLLTGMLGFGAFRSFERSRGVVNSGLNTERVEVAQATPTPVPAPAPRRRDRYPVS